MAKFSFTLKRLGQSSWLLIINGILVQVKIYLWELSQKLIFNT